MRNNKQKAEHLGDNKSTRAVKTVAVMMGATVIAKLLGMLRGVLQANAYGTTEAANAFTAASKLPLTFFDLFLAAAVMGCFIPVYNSFKEHDSDAVKSGEADEFACVFLNLIILLCGILALIGIIFADSFIGLITNGLSEETVKLAVTLTRIMFPLVIFTGSAYTLVGVLQSKGSFIAPALISAVSNAGVVFYLAFLNEPLGRYGIYGLAASYLMSWLIQFLTLVIPLYRMGFRYRFRFNLKNPALIRALKMAPPIMIGSWLTPAGTLLGQYFAADVASSGAISGATTVFDYANNVYIIIAGTLTYSICNYTFPKISRLSASGNDEEFAATVRSGLISALYIVVPFMAAALVLAGEGTAVIYMRGEFTSADTINTARALRFILPAMPFFCAMELFSRAFYSKKKTIIPMIAAVGGIIANIAVGWVLTSFELFDIGAVGAANGAGQMVSTMILLIASVKYIRGVFSRELIIGIAKICIGGALVFASSFVLSRLVASNPYDALFAVNVVKSLIIFIPSAVIYLFYSKLAKLSVGLA